MTDDSTRIDTPSVSRAPETAEQMRRLWADPPGLIGKLMAVQNDAIGKRMKRETGGFSPMRSSGTGFYGSWSP